MSIQENMGYSGLNMDVLCVVANALHVRPEEIQIITALKKGMTNHSFLFSCNDEQYILRVPGEGTEQMIDRYQEAASYGAIKGKGLCDDPIYLDPGTGIKITKYIPNLRVCNPENESDLLRCVQVLRNFHGMKLKVGHAFDLFQMIEYYERLWKGCPSEHGDYQQTKQNVFSLIPWIDKHKNEFYLTHIDAVADNFLLCMQENGTERIQLTDWEYAGMQDQDVDLAMFCIYSAFSKAQVDHLIDLYFEGNCPPLRRTKVYCYISVSGLLWSNWCEYKKRLGVDFGEYASAQYRYAKEYFMLVKEEMSTLTEDWNQVER